MSRKFYRSLAQQESRLAFFMLLPPFLLVFLIVLFPVLLNFWISVKPLQLAELRPPEVLLRQKVQTTESGSVLSLDIRNSSKLHPIKDVRMMIRIPAGLTVTHLPSVIVQEGDTLQLQYDLMQENFRSNLDIAFRGSTTLSEFPISLDFRVRNPFIFSSFTLKNFASALATREFFPSLLTTILYATGGALGAILLGTSAALLLWKNTKTKGPLSALLLFPYISPVVAATLIWVFLLDPRSGMINNLLIQFGVLETGIEFLSMRSLPVQLGGLTVNIPLALTTLILFDAWRYFPFIYLFITARLQAIPIQLYEAADVDGAGPFQQFFYITIPQLMGVMTTMFILRFMWTFNKFDDVFLLTGGAAGTTTLPIQVYDSAFGRGDLGQGAAFSVLLFAFLSLYIFLYSRYKPEDQG